MAFEKVGEIAVDAGIVMIGDPCYHLHKSTDDRIEFGTDWNNFVDLVYCKEKQDVTDIGNGTAIVVGGFGGDGRFPVYIKRGSDGIVEEIVIRFHECEGNYILEYS